MHTALPDAVPLETALAVIFRFASRLISCYRQDEWRDYTDATLALAIIMRHASSAVAAKSSKETSLSETTRFACQDSTTFLQLSPRSTSGRGSRTPVWSLFQTNEISVTVPIPPRSAIKPTDRVIRFCNRS